MNRIIFLIIFLSFILISFNSFAEEELNKNYEYQYDESQNDMFSEYIDQNSSDFDNKSTKMYENQYVFEWYPYISMKYTSKNLQDEDKENSNAIEKR